MEFDEIEDEYDEGLEFEYEDIVEEEGLISNAEIREALRYRHFSIETQEKQYWVEERKREIKLRKEEEEEEDGE